MGVAIKCRKSGHTIDMGSGGFFRLRKKVAELTNSELGQHYALLTQNMFGRDDEWYENYDKQLELIINKHKISIKIIDFLYQSDIEGKIRYGACKQILKVIGDYDDNFAYGYAGQKDCAKFKDFKNLLEECAQFKCDLIWY